MTDPVKLPTSGITMDRSSIKRMLLNDEWDPINRKPLKMSDLVDDIELKKRIEKWIDQKWWGVVTDEEIREKELLKKEKEEKQDKDVKMIEQPQS